jgi:hypothetical protein
VSSPPPPPQVSPDGKFYWDGVNWVPMAAHSAGSSSRATNLPQTGAGKPNRMRRARMAIAGGILSLVISVTIAVLAVPQLVDSVTYLLASRCPSGTTQSNSCNVEKRGTLSQLISQNDPNDPSSGSCTYLITFDDHSTASYTVGCAQFATGDAVTGRFWKGRLVLLTGDQAFGTAFGEVGPVIATTFSVVLLFVGLTLLVYARRMSQLPGTRIGPVAEVR